VYRIVSTYGMLAIETLPVTKLEAGMEPLLSLIIFLIIAAIVLWLVQTIAANLPVTPTLRSIILAVAALLLLLIFLQRVGIL